MTFIDISDLLYKNSNEINFGKKEVWESDTFTSIWFSNLNIIKPNSAGLYWFLTNSKFTNIKKPTSLPDNGCDFQETTLKNINTFPDNLLSRPSKNELKVIYNGHEKNVMSRVRQHFSLSNNRTGALGIKHYSLSNQNWVLRYFTSMDINRLKKNKTDRDLITKLLDNKTGRTALENAWRIKNGWPVLCKE